MSEDRQNRLKKLWGYYRNTCLQEMATKHWCRVPDSLNDDAVTLDFELQTMPGPEAIKIVVFEMKTGYLDMKPVAWIEAEGTTVEGPWNVGS